MLTFHYKFIYCSLFETEVIIVVLLMFSYDLEFTVAHNLVAVSTGFLLYQVATSDTITNILLFKFLKHKQYYFYIS